MKNKWIICLAVLSLAVSGESLADSTWGMGDLPPPQLGDMMGEIPPPGPPPPPLFEQPVMPGGPLGPPEKEKVDPPPGMQPPDLWDPESDCVWITAEFLICYVPGIIGLLDQDGDGILD